jgi:hypothetical protein
MEDFSFRIQVARGWRWRVRRRPFETPVLEARNRKQGWAKNRLARPASVWQDLSIMRWLRQLAAFCLLGWVTALGLIGAEYRLIDGTVLSGELISADKDAFVLRLEGGGYSPRTDWGKLSDESLLAMSKVPKAAKFVEPYVTLPTPEEVRRERKPFKIAEVQRVPHPQVPKGAFAAVMTPGGLFFIGLMYLANIFFGFEVARFRWRPPVLVCGLAAVLPIIGPLIFLAMPKWAPPEEVNATAEAMDAQTLTVADSGPSMVQQMGLRAGGPAARAEELPRTFRKGEFTFNRRFFESQFEGFLPSASPEAAAGLVMEITSGTGTVVSNKINRMNATEVIVEAASGGEAHMEYGSILEITLRHA